MDDSSVKIQLSPCGEPSKYLLLGIHLLIQQKTLLMIILMQPNLPVASIVFAGNWVAISDLDQAIVDLAQERANNEVILPAIVTLKYLKRD